MTNFGELIPGVSREHQKGPKIDPISSPLFYLRLYHAQYFQGHGLEQSESSVLVDHQGLAKASNNSDVGSGSSFCEVEAESSIPAEGAERVLLKYPHLLVHRVDALNANSGIYIEDLLE